MIDHKKIKVLFIITTLERMGGAEKNLYDVVTNLNRILFYPIVVTFRTGEVSDKLKHAGQEVYKYPVQKVMSFSSLMEARKLASFLKESGVNIVVTYHHDADMWGILVALFAGNIPVISSRRDMGYQLTKKHIWFYRLFSNRFRKVIAVSGAVKNEVIKREWTDSSRFISIHNGLELSKYNSQLQIEGIRRELNLSTENIVIGMVASFRPIKGQEYLVEAIKEVVEAFPQIKVVIAGYTDTDYFRSVSERIADLNLTEYFHILGERQDVPDLLQIFDIFVISSINEGFSNAIIEAMAAGKPVIATNSGGNPEAVINGVTGFLFPPRDSHILAQKILALLNDDNLRKKMGENGKVTVQEKFKLQHMMDKVEMLFRDVFNG